MEQLDFSQSSDEDVTIIRDSVNSFMGRVRREEWSSHDELLLADKQYKRANEIHQLCISELDKRITAQDE